MSDPRHARVRELFAAALDRPAAGRAAFLARECRGDEALRAEVTSLLAHHDERTLLPAGAGPARHTTPADGPGPATPRKLRPAPGMAAAIARARERGARRLLLGALAVALLLVPVGLWSLSELHAALQAEVASRLDTLLDTGAAGLRAWIDVELHALRDRADEPRVVADAAALVALALEGPAGPAAGPGAGLGATLAAAPQQATLDAALAGVMARRDVRAWALVDAQGVLLARGLPPGWPVQRSVGERIASEHLPKIERVLREGSRFEAPFQLGSPMDVATAGTPGTPATDAPPADAPPADAPPANASPAAGETVLSLLVPVPGPDGTPLAVLVVLVDPEADFARLLAAARWGETGETYAFDATGRLLTPSRFEHELRAAGLLADGEGSVLSLPLRRPGVDLAAGQRLGTPRETGAPDAGRAAGPDPRSPANPRALYAARPRTLPVREGPAGFDGTDADGYEGYLGREVVGTWRWLPELGFGLATEIARDEAFAALAAPRRALGVLLALLALSALALLLTSRFLRRVVREEAAAPRLGPYVIERLLGEGGMGRVYLAHHELLLRPTAVKVLRPEVLSPESLARFEREVRLTARLTHPNTIEIWDYGRDEEGGFYYAMEPVDGLTLQELLALDGPQPAARVLHVLAQVAGSLAEAHAQGLVHRDIKPGNIFLCVRGGEHDVVKVVDFGLVREVREAPEERLTDAGGVLGTPRFLAPERLRDPGAVDPRVDTYAVGAVAFALLAGKEPWAGLGAIEAGARALIEEAPALSGVDGAGPVPPELERLVADCLARDPARRPADGAALRARLDLVVAALEARGDPAARWTRAQAGAWWARHAGAARAAGEPRGAVAQAT